MSRLGTSEVCKQTRMHAACQMASYGHSTNCEDATVAATVRTSSSESSSQVEGMRHVLRPRVEEMCRDRGERLEEVSAGGQISPQGFLFCRA
jgi:hypothetical protein